MWQNQVDAINEIPPDLISQTDIGLLEVPMDQ